MEQKIVFIVLLFYVMSFLGWCIEVLLKYRQFHRFIKRGFLTGPWLPLYGSGSVLITICVNAIANLESTYGNTFLISFILCGALEYTVSFFLEKRYHARWWDYSTKPMNLNGRIWIGNLILFGLGGVIIIHVINPLFTRLLENVPFQVQRIIAISISVIFLSDVVISGFVMKLVKDKVDASEADNTEDISKEIRNLLKDRAYFYSRFADSYPEVIYRTDRIKERLARIKEETERLAKEAEARFAEGKARLAASLESNDSIKTTVIRKQDELIELLYSEENATERQKQLLAEISEQKDRIRKRTILPGGGKNRL